MHTKLLLSSMTVLMGLTFSIHSVSAHGFSPQVAPLSDSPSAEVHHPSSQPSSASSNSFTAIQTVLSQHMGQPYLWGATGPTAFDCSGLTQYTFKKALNLNLNRTAEQQFNQFRHVSHDQVRPGDLIFFSYNHGQSIDHVGIIVEGQNMMVDAQNRGVIRECYLVPWWRGYIAGYARVIE
ncbi:MAG: NlpC/P60 family protein [Pediococcus pentosaceus]|jgi:Cell wall-associated hydrolases (invasion-associated proteins)|nr:NlpC/P60 family protein [Pediococcus pentosaceus]MCD5257130.1 C40 family peptidase [Pediococcus pentosaceus]MCH3989376.1 NlpC/P60 family protein [Pediococcus pentosaceus]MCH4098143.1 NlpC/P60 family protein [Pediococcus pentosaceus]MCI1284873.1 NlpC/P60 family protein [Pediococcus pentosaceus]MCI1347580.1 NlpC/P60 family protein [Pediococcus pentosaceus]